MKRPLSKIIQTGFVCVFTIEVCLTSVAEANFWAERRKSNLTEIKSQPTQLAALPSSLAKDPATFLKQMPISATLPRSLKNQGAIKSNSLAASIPLIYSTIQDVYNGDKSKASVMLLQDVHLNSEAQTNLAAVLQELIDQNKVGLVGVEGAFGEFDFAPFRAVADKAKARALTQKFLEENKLGAPSFVGITSEKTLPAFVGIDDPEHYEANVEAYLNASDQKEKLVAQLHRLEIELEQNKKVGLSRELKLFDGLRTSYQSNKIGLGPYINQLAVLAPETDFVVDQFLEAYQMEQALNIPRVEFERKAVLEKLLPLLKENEVAQLTAQSIAYRLGRITFGDYYQHLKDLCQKKDIQLSRTPAFDNYIRYVLLVDGIQSDKLFSAIKKMEEAVLMKLARTEQEKELMQRSQWLALVGKLKDFALTSEEWGEYKQLTEYHLQLTISGGAAKPRKLISSSNSQWSAVNGKLLQPFESFYDEADIRSTKMVANLLSAPSTGPRVLISGGFHTDQIKDLLKQKKISYVVASPKLTRLDDNGSSYLTVFAREKTPLEKIFTGHKLFINPVSTAVGLKPNLSLRQWPNIWRLVQKTLFTSRDWLSSMGQKPRTQTSKPTGGLIGKYQVLSPPVFDRAKGELRFRGRNVETGKEEDIILPAESIKPEHVHKLFFNQFYIPNHMVNTIMEWFLTGQFEGEVLRLKPNPYGIKGIGSEKIIAVAEEFKNDFVAFFHEVAEAMGARAYGLTARDILANLADRSWFDEHVKKDGRSGLELHYAIRALQREAFARIDSDLTRKIKSHPIEQILDEAQKIQENTDDKPEVRFSKAIIRLHALRSFDDDLVAAAISSRVEQVFRIAHWQLSSNPLLDAVLSKNAIEVLGEDITAKIFAHLFPMIMSKDYTQRSRAHLFDTLTRILEWWQPTTPKIKRQLADMLIPYARHYLSGRLYLPRAQLSDVPDVDKYFEIDSEHPDQLFFGENFMKRLAYLRDLPQRKRLERLFREEKFEKDAIRDTYQQLLAKDKDGKLFDSLMAELRQPQQDTHFQLALVALLTDHLNENLPQFEDKTTFLIAQIKGMIRTAPGMASEYLLISNLNRLCLKPLSIAQMKSIASFAIEEMPEMARHISTINVVDHQAFKDAMKMMEMYLKTLTYLARKAKKLATPDGKALGDRIERILVKAADDPKWDHNIRADAAWLLLESIEQDSKFVIGWALSELAPDIPFEMRHALERAFDEEISSEEVLRLLRVIPKLLNSRIGYLLIRRHKAYPYFLKEVIFDDSLDIHFRLAAFNWYASRFIAKTKARKDGRYDWSHDGATYKLMREALEKDAETLVRDRIAEKNTAIELFDNTVAREEELKVITMATFFFMNKHVPVTTVKSAVYISQMLLGAHVMDYSNDITSGYLLGRRKIDHLSQTTDLFQALAHEIMHNVLHAELDYSVSDLKSGIIHELLADLYTFSFSDLARVESEPFTVFLRYDQHSDLVTTDNYHSVEVHEGARAQLNILRNELKARGLNLQADKLIMAAKLALQKSEVRKKDVRSFVSLILKMSANKREAESRFSDFFSEGEDFMPPVLRPDFDELETPDPEIKQKILDPVGIGALLAFLFPSSQPASILDKKLRAKQIHINHPVFYAFYTIVLVNWEIIFQLVVPLVFWWSYYDLTIGWVTNGVMAAVFALVHPDRSWGKFINLFVVGLGFGAWFFTPMAFGYQVLGSMATHPLYNFMKWMDWVPSWMHFASIGKKISQEEEEEEEIAQEKKLGWQEFYFFKHEYGFLPDDHPATRFCRERLRKLLPGLNPNDVPQIYILAGTGEGVNAFAFPDASIMFTSELLRFIDYQDELDAVILHELNHVFDRDSDARIESMKLESLRHQLGTTRYHEYKADMKAFFQMADPQRQTSPGGMLVFLEKIRKEKQKQKKLHWDIAHGNLEDRILNLKTISRFINFFNLGRPLRPLPAEIHQSLENLKEVKNYRKYFSDNKLIQLNNKNLDKEINETLRTISWDSLNPFIIQVKEKMNYQIHYSNRVEAERFQYILPRLEEKWDVLFEQRYGHLSPVVRSIFKHLYKVVILGISNFEEMGNIDKTHLEALGEAIKLIDLPFEKEALQKYIYKTMSSALGAGAVFDTDDGIEFEVYFQTAIQLIKRVKEQENRLFLQDQFGDLGQTLGNLWWESVIAGMDQLMDLKIWNKNEARYLMAIERIMAEEKNLKLKQTPGEIMDLIARVTGSSNSRIAQRIRHHYKILSEDEFHREIKLRLAELKTIPTGEFTLSNPKVRNLLSKVAVYNTEDRTRETSINTFMKEVDRHRVTTFEELKTVVTFYWIIFGQYRNFHSEIFKINLDDINLTTVSIDEVKRFDILIQDEKYFNSEFPDLINVRQYKGSMLETSLLRDLIFRITKFKLDHCKKGDEFFLILDNYLKEFELIQSAYAIKPADLEAKKIEILKKGLSFLDLKGPPTTNTLKRLFLISFFIDEPTIQIPLQEYILKKFLSQANLREILDLFLRDYVVQGPLVGFRFVDLIEEKLETPKDIEELKSMGHDIFFSNKRRMENFGEGVIADGLLTQLMENQDPFPFLEALLVSNRDDIELRDLLSKYWWELLGERASLDLHATYDFQVLEQGKNIKEWVNDPIYLSEVGFEKAEKWKYVPLDFYLNAIYRLGFEGRYLLLRKILVGRNGILARNPIKIMKSFLRTYVTSNGDSTIKDLIETVLAAFFHVAPMDELYLFLSPLLVNRIGYPPQQATNWKKNVENMTTDVIGEYGEYRDKKPFKVKLRRIIEGRSVGSRLEMERNRIHAQLSQLFPKDFFTKNIPTLTPLQLVIETARQLGAPGARFLQLLGQVVPLPPEYRREFLVVYDDLRSQSKISAWETIKREAPEYAQQIKRFVTRLGGGSLFTVFEVELKDGTHEVVRILNPNVHYHADVSLKIMSEALDELAISDSKYAQAKPLITILRQWIFAELDDPTFQEDDKLFRKKWNGWKPRGFRSSVVVPESHFTYQGIKTESPLVRREQKIEGKNFTEMDAFPVEKRREMVALAVQHYFAQIKGSLLASESLVHSDISPGNLRITADGNLAILDRGMYLKFSLSDRLFLGKLLNKQNNEERIKMFAEWIWNLPENKEVIQKLNRNDLLHKIRNRSNENRGDLEQIAMNVLIEIHAHELFVPLNFTLLFRNLDAFNRIAKMADPNWTLKDAFEYNPQGKKYDPSSHGGSNLLYLIQRSLSFKSTQASYLTLLSVFLVEALGLRWINLNTGPPVILCVAVAFIVLHAILRFFLFRQQKLSGLSAIRGSFIDTAILSLYFLCTTFLDISWISVAIHLFADYLFLRSDIKRSSVLAQTLMALVPSEKMIGEKLTSKNHILTFADIRQDVLNLIQEGDLNSLATQSRIADKLFILREVLSKEEVQQLVASLELDRDHASWVNTAAQAKSLIQALLSSPTKTNRLVLGFDEANKKLFDDLKQDKSLKIDQLLENGRLRFVASSSKITAPEFVLEARTVLGTKPREQLSLIILEGTLLPAQFFNLSPAEFRLLEKQVTVVLLTQALQAVELRGMLLPNWVAFRAALIQA